MPSLKCNASELVELRAREDFAGCLEAQYPTRAAVESSLDGPVFGVVGRQVLDTGEARATASPRWPAGVALAKEAEQSVLRAPLGTAGPCAASLAEANPRRRALHAGSAAHGASSPTRLAAPASASRLSRTLGLRPFCPWCSCRTERFSCRWSCSPPLLSRSTRSAVRQVDSTCPSASRYPRELRGPSSSHRGVRHGD
jgi:hypothetical protein